ncbi:MAG TPA: hypothetical protein VLA19_10220 [Herpetosiphonaceae bacterium]|nr:hypothetical protein [Herpetosiphonaceae bacterium]
MYRLRDEYKGRVAIVSINPRTRQAKALTDDLGTAFTPTFVFVGTDGNVRNMFLGEVDAARLRQELDALLQTP